MSREQGLALGARDEGGHLRRDEPGELCPLPLNDGEEPRRLERDHGLIGEQGDEADLLVGEGLRLDPPGADDPDHDVVAEHRHAEHRAELAELEGVRVVVLHIVEDIRDVDGFALERGPPGQRRPTRADRVGKVEGDDLGTAADVCDVAVDVAIEEVDEASLRVAQPRRILEYRVEHEFEIEGGPPDGPKDFAEGDPLGTGIIVGLGRERSVRGLGRHVGRIVTNCDPLRRAGIGLGYRPASDSTIGAIASIEPAANV